MLTVVDPSNDGRAEIGGRPGRVVRLCVLLPEAGEGRESRPGELRALVTADLVRRVLKELHGAQVMVAVAGPGIDQVTLRRRLDPLWVQEPAGIAASLEQAPEALWGAVDLAVAPPGAELPAVAGMPVLRVAEVTGDVDAAAGQDASALRMLLLSWHYRRPVRLGAGELALAAATLRHWRDLVAGWAAQPSVVMPDDLAKRAYAACDDDLDIPEILALLHRLEHDGDIPDGAKFETCAHLDRVLALDLAAHLGSA